MKSETIHGTIWTIVVMALALAGVMLIRYAIWMPRFMH